MARKFKLLNLLNSMNQAEHARFKKFLKSPFFTTDERCLALYEYLRRNNPAWEDEKINKKTLHKKLFPKTAVNEKNVTDLMHRLSGLVETFFVIRETLDSPKVRQQTLVRSLTKRKLHPYFEKEANRLKKIISGQKTRDMQFYLEQYQLEHDWFHHPETMRTKPNNVHFKEMVTNMEHFFSLAVLRYACEKNNREAVFKEKAKLLFLEDVLKIAEKHFTPSNPVFELYLYLLRLQQNGFDMTLFDKICSGLTTKYFPLLNEDEQFAVLLMTINIGIKEISTNGTNLYPHIFDLYKFALEEKYLIRDGYIVDSIFVSIVVAACYNKAYKWTERFIKDNKENLKKEKRKDALFLSKAYIMFQKGNYDQTLSHIQHVKFHNHSYSVRTKALEVRCIYELSRQGRSNYDELLVSKLHAFERWLYNRKKKDMSKHKAESYLNFIRLTQKLLSCQNNSNQATKKKLKENLDNITPLALRGWLNKKIIEL
ncbi:MAG TPA: hypothetical protein ENJ20_06235 [Bacteroidetes bacterium]|nr:hypothetical protein [Bacteroidota bacterium]